MNEFDAGGGALPAGLNRKPVGAVLNAVSILRYLAEQSAPVGITQVARTLALNPSTCFNILRTLAGERFVFFDPATKTYKLGQGVADLAQGATIFGRNVDVVRGLIERIANDHDVAVTLWRPVSEDRMLLILAAFTAGQTRIHMSVGEHLPLLIGSAGRIMAAFMDLGVRELRRQFKQIRWEQPMSFEEYMAEVKEARDRGWSIDKGNYIAGISSVAAPIFDDAGRLIMACTATTFSQKLDMAQAERVGKELARLRVWSRFGA
ncbi:MAG: IclR family transcriptional regulator [Burkholderiaceae bacterium]|nr:IclR family transcriptional regulator [Burkholderiaceae bacterium]